MEYVPLDGGRSWTWEYGDLKYQAYNWNGSPNLQVYTEKIDDPDDWAFAFRRPTNGRSAQVVAQEICDEVIGGKHDEETGPNQ